MGKIKEYVTYFGISYAVAFGVLILGTGRMKYQLDTWHEWVLVQIPIVAVAIGFTIMALNKKKDEDQQKAREKMFKAVDEKLKQPYSEPLDKDKN